MNWNPTPKKIPKNLFGKRKDQEFVGLVQAALEDQKIRQHFFTLLVPSRLNQLQKWEIELEQEHVSQPLINAIGLLKDTGSKATRLHLK